MAGHRAVLEAVPRSGFGGVVRGLVWRIQGGLYKGLLIVPEGCCRMAAQGCGFRVWEFKGLGSGL